MSGVLKVRLSQLETRATALEKHVLKQLKSLEYPTNKDRHRVEEGKIMSLLFTLDAIQAEIDTTIAELKAAGEWVPLDYSGNVYKYVPPKVQATPKPPRQEWKPRKEYPIASKAEIKRAAEKAAREARKAERLAAKELREAEQQAAREARQAAKEARQAAIAAKPKARRGRPPKPKSVRPPKAKPVPRPKTAPKSKELLRAERGAYDAKRYLSGLDTMEAAARIKLERRIEEHSAKLAEALNLSKAENGPMKRFTAKAGIARAEQLLDELSITYAEKRRITTDRLNRYESEIRLLTEIHSQV
jgi:hypothetical protein